MKELDSKEKIKKFYFIDQKFKENKARYLVQCLMATVALAVILYAMDAVFNASVIAAFGATSFIVFAMPNLKTSIPRRILGGYIICIILGIALYEGGSVLCSLTDQRWIMTILGAIAIGSSILMMTMTNTEHPPAAGVALGIVLEGYTWNSVIIILVGVLSLIAVKWLLRRWLINLF